MNTRVCFFGAVAALLMGTAGCSKPDDIIISDQPPVSFSSSDTSLFTMHGHLVSYIALDTSNYVEVPVRVHRVGPWEFSTGNIGGFEFSGSGTFTDTGLNMIQLYGSGIPQKSGSLGFAINQGNAIYNDAVLVEDGYMDFHINNTDYSLSTYPGSSYELSLAITKVQSSSQISFRPQCEYRDPKHYFETPHMNVEYVEFLSPSELSGTFQSNAYSPGNKLLGNYFTNLPGFSFSFYYPEYQFLLTASVDQDNDSYMTVLQRGQFIGRYVTSSAGDSSDVTTYKLKVKFDLKVGRGITEAGRLTGDGILQLQLAKEYP